MKEIPILAWIDNLDGSYSYSLPALLKWVVALIVAEWLAIPNAMRTLLIFMTVDYGTGIAAAFMRREVSSATGFRGLLKKGLVLIVLLTVHLIERLSGIDIQIEHIAAVGYTINEAISIIENLAKAGIPIPATIVQALMSIQKFRMQEATPEQLQELEMGSHPATQKATVKVKVADTTPSSQDASVAE